MHFYVSARKGGRRLQELTGEQRSEIIITLSDLLLSKKDSILEANAADIELAKETGKYKIIICLNSLMKFRIKMLIC